MIHQLRANGYLHLHNGEIRLALTLHGRKGLPVVTRVALLDTRFREYQNACIATLQATLNVGTMCVTLFPNLKVALKDPQIYQNMKIQLQILALHKLETHMLQHFTRKWPTESKTMRWT